MSPEATEPLPPGPEGPVRTEALIEAVTLQCSTVQLRLLELESRLRADNGAATALALADVSNATMVLVVRIDLAAAHLTVRSEREGLVANPIRPLRRAMRSTLQRVAVYCARRRPPHDDGLTAQLRRVQGLLVLLEHEDDVSPAVAARATRGTEHSRLSHRGSEEA